METTPKFTETTEKMAAEVQQKTKNVIDKSAAVLGEYADFAKGNVEALVESGKIFTAGLQGMGNTMVAETKTVLETMSADAKQLAGVKSPTDFLKVQTDVLRRNFDTAVAMTSKNSEAVMKLASDSFAPISGRFSLAVEKLKTAA